MRWTVLRRFAISCLVAALALACHARTRPHYGGTLRVEIEGDPWNGPDGLTRRLVFDGLTALAADGTVRAALAIEWETSDNDHRWQFHLRPDVHFQDGSALTSTAVAASLNISCPQNCPWNAVRAAGPLVVFTFDSPTPNLPALLARDEFLIAEIAATGGGAPRRTIGTGPFSVTSFDSGVMTLAANDDCWQGRPFLDAIEIRTHRPIRDQWLDLNVGRADVVQVPPELLREAHQQQLKIMTSAPVTLLALQVSDSGSLSNPALRGAIAMAVDRSALFNVIFQKQGEIAAGLLPQSLTGYAFLFPVDRNLNKAHELRGGLAVPALTLGVEGNGAMQLAAQRILLNLHEAGFNVQATSNQQRPDLMLRKLQLEGAAPATAMESVLKSAGQFVPVTQQTPEALFEVERNFLNLDTLIPLIDLPRAYAVGGRARDLALSADGTPDLANASLEDAP
jgi:peptide/nickel transport system substrate-binding protein